MAGNGNRVIALDAQRMTAMSQGDVGTLNALIADELVYTHSSARLDTKKSLIDNMHSQFIQAVADGRKMKYQDVKVIADGKVWTGQQAASMKLIDQVADFQAAVKDTAKSVGISGEPTLVRPEKERKTVLDLLFGDISQYLPTREKLMEQQMGFYYLWQ